jgi:hypothetical protein
LLDRAEPHLRRAGLPFGGQHEVTSTAKSHWMP